MRRSCSDSPVTASQMDWVFGSDSNAVQVRGFVLERRVTQTSARMLNSAAGPSLKNKVSMKSGFLLLASKVQQFLYRFQRA